MWLAAGAAVLTTALTAVSFWLSFEALHDLATAHRLQGERAWAWPATVDAFIAIGEVLILRASLMHRVDWWAIALTSVGSVGSIALNVAGVGVSHDPLDYVTAAVPPVAALLAFGVLMRQVHEFLVSRQQVVTAPPMPVSAPAPAVQESLESVAPEPSRQNALTAPPVPSVPLVTPVMEAEEPEAPEEPQEAVEAPEDGPEVTEEPEPVTEPEQPQEPLTQREQMDLIIRGLYDALGNRRPTTKLMTDALENAGLPSSDGTARESRKRVEAAEPHLKTLPSALAA
ncbi:DUF2637 domain-containing protein [Streptomyces avermitilis]|uniref:DUF2637 domain-containing protein n=1 Tax=Streptomyces avermitilis TaxID=33903 RepID=UPI00370FE6EF